jgi:polyisoprenoid-binding protein YceI
VWALVTAAFAVLAVWSPGRAAPRIWRVDRSQSRLVVHVFRKGLLSPALHDHHFVPERWSATVAFDPARPDVVDIRVTVAADSLRDRQPELSPDDIRKVEAQARGPKGLDAERYPVIAFTADRLELSGPPSEAAGSARGVLAGVLELHGRARPVRTPLRARWTAGSLDAEGEMSVNQSDFGIEPYRALLGAIAVHDRVSVEFAVRATAEPGETERP